MSAVDDERAGSTDVDGTELTTDERIVDGSHLSQDSLAQVSLTFNAPVNAEGAQFGVASPANRAPRTGRISNALLTRLRKHYVAPGNYDVALSQLLRERVVVLVGKPGAGRRAGAVSLLREVSEKPIISLSPILLQEIADRGFSADFVYVVPDWAELEPGEFSEGALERVIEAVSDCRTFLVLCADIESPSSTELVGRCVDWERPPAKSVIAAYLAEAGLLDTDPSEPLSALPASFSMSSLAGFANRLASGETVQVARDEFEEDARETVVEWFRGERTSREILDVTALSFLEGATERQFESLRAELENHVAATYPPLSDSDSPGGIPLIFDQWRAARGSRESLFEVVRESAQGNARRRLRFRSESVRRLVVSELWERFDYRFWNAVHSWIDDMICKQPSTEVARGVALLAKSDINEVEALMLNPWSHRRSGWSGQIQASYVIWHMAQDDALSSAALRIAMRWSRSKAIEQQWTSALALSGEIGIRYPSYVLERLFQVATEPTSALLVNRFYALALANLFARVVDANLDDAAGGLLSKLANELKLARNSGRPEKVRLMAATALAVLDVRILPARDAAFLLIMRRRPAVEEVVGRIWELMLAHPGYRKSAIEALILSFDPNTDKASRDAAVLGAAISCRLNFEDRERLKGQMVHVNGRLKSPASPRVSQALLNAIERAKYDLEAPQ